MIHHGSKLECKYLKRRIRHGSRWQGGVYEHTVETAYRTLTTGYFSLSHNEAVSSLIRQSTPTRRGSTHYQRLTNRLTRRRNKRICDMLDDFGQHREIIPYIRSEFAWDVW